MRTRWHPGNPDAVRDIEKLKMGGVRPQNPFDIEVGFTVDFIELHESADSVLAHISRKGTGVKKSQTIIPFETRDGPFLKAGKHYKQKRGEINFKAGEKSQTISIQLLGGKMSGRREKREKRSKRRDEFLKRYSPIPPSAVLKLNLVGNCIRIFH